MKKKGLLKMLFGLCLVSVLVALSVMSVSAQQIPKMMEFPKDVKIGSPAGSTVPVTQGLCSIIKKEWGIPALTYSGKGSAELLAVLIDKEADMSLGMADVITMALRGTGFFKEKGSQPVRLVMTLMVAAYTPATWHGSGIKTIKDVRGKRFMYQWSSSPTNTTIGDRLLEFHGMTSKDLIVLKLGNTQDGVNALAHKTADLIMLPGASSGGFSYWIELCLMHDIDFIPLTKEEQDYVIKKEPYIVTNVLPANTYKRQDMDVACVGCPLSYCVTRDTNDDFVYKVCKILLDDVGPETPGRFTQYHKFTGAFTLNLALKAAGLAPFHAGAVKYFKERGVWTPELEKAQKRILAEFAESR